MMYRRHLLKIGFLIAVAIFGLGTQQCPDYRRATLSCDDIFSTVEPDSCAIIRNPCEESGEWNSYYNDGFNFETNVDGVSLRTTRVDDVTTREICIAADSPRYQSEPIPYIYGNSNDFGRGYFNLSVGYPLTVEPVAYPSTTIPVGGTVQLSALTSGGFRPYFYRWIGPVSDDDISGPSATLTNTYTFIVYVHDSNGNYTSGEVTVYVGMDLTATADPSEIGAGDAAILEAIASGGALPYTYSWTPTDSLDDPTRQDPIATPQSTTTYYVTVTDALGNQRTTPVTVFVALPSPTPTPVPTPVPVSAFFTYTVICCPKLVVNAGGSTGPITTYTWDLSWTPLSPDLVTTSPQAQFTIVETNRGTINLTVADGAGNTSSFSRNF